MSFYTLDLKKIEKKKVIIGALYILNVFLHLLKDRQFVCYPQ